MRANASACMTEDGTVDAELVAAVKCTGEDAAWHLASLLNVLTMRGEALWKQCWRIALRLRRSAGALLRDR